MEIIHRISVVTKDEAFWSAFDSMDIEYVIGQVHYTGDKTIILTIGEANPYWDTVIKWVKKHEVFKLYGTGDRFDTSFSDDEVRKASWLRLIPTFEQGDPQPISEWPIKQSSLELFCSKCCRYRQFASMRLKKEPHMGRKSFVIPVGQIETFCTPEVFKAFEEINAKGYSTRDVVVHKTGETIENVRQLCVPGIANPGMIPYKGLVKEICPVCGQPKYYSHMKGAMQIKEKALLSGTDFMQTYEWFGSGYIAYREMLVSNRIANLILDKGWLGVRFKVVKLV